MTCRILLLALTGIGALALLAGVIWFLSLPSPTHRTGPVPVADGEYTSVLHALKPPKRKRPLIAIVGINDATETTDYLVPYGVLRNADVADVVTLSTGDGPVRLYPALTVRAQATVAQFDQRNPQGADYVIVPAMSRDDDPTVLAWLRSQREKGAIIIGICAGAKVLAGAGLLENRRATTHWYYLKTLLRDYKNIRYVPDRRWVVDDGVATTTGITASIPMMLTLIEAIAGRDKAQQAGESLGVAQWHAGHDSQAFQLTRPFALTVMKNTMSFWRKEQFTLQLQPGVNEAALALVADAWSRTYLSRVTTRSINGNPVVSGNGMPLLADQTGDQQDNNGALPSVDMTHPADTLKQTLEAIAARYGAPTAQVVAMQLEYPWRKAR
ncbi:transcriptional regulator [Advenella kashmirensis W13003]|uniref:Transcriptional regulator n=1 Tax=Advenella kashmirensis W13003 TaxID=1424334 RepID=V8QMD6_9BURK|nr:DJ-1/PfpI family protein [Advenella kashmirensis]ETF01111.1 transcriptional regulator [Advenella kashmirensis W13003]